MVVDKSFDPVDIGIDGVLAEVTEGGACSDLIEESRLVHRKQFGVGMNSLRLSAAV